jgi:DNA (cytosine-5)-methyltransferase 3A
MENINVLSLFDGMSCGQQALERVGIKVNNYFASEIDKYAIQVTQKNFPNTIQLGSVLDVDGYKLPKIDLLMGGSPCQSFSFAGKRKGMSTKCETEILTLEHYLQLKSEDYEFEGQSYLFWEFMRILNEVKPKYFLLENVEMGEKWEKVLSKAIGVNGIHINSALVSAQNRKRIYWTNIGMQPMGLFGYPESIIQQPKDKGILLKDILESEVEEKYFLSDKMIAGFERHKERHNDKGTGFGYIPKTETDKGNSLRANAALCPTDNMLIVHNLMPRSSTTGKGGTGPLSRNDGKTYCLDTGNTNAVEIVAQRGRGEKGNIEQQLEARKDGKTNCLTSVQKDNLIRQLNPSLESGGKQPYQQNRIYDTDGISPALCANKSDLLITSGTLRTHKDGEGFREVQSGKGATIPARAREDGSGQNVVAINSRIRRLTPIECERLQTVKDNYTNHVSDSQRYKMLGNGWTISVIAHIFSYIK